MSVLVVGEALVDVVTAPDAPPVAHVGGSPLNVAVGLGRLGVPTTFAAQVGRDRNGEAIVEQLRAAGVALSRLSPTPRRTSTAAARLSAAGGAAYAFDLSWDPAALPDLGGFGALHVGSIATVLAPGAARVVELAAAAHRRGVPVSVDPNVRLAVEPDPGAWRRAFAALLPHAEMVKLSDEDAGVLAPGVPAAELAARLAGEDRLAVVTCGAAGAHAATPACRTRVAAEAVEVADTIGAGDSFTAALLAWLAWRGRPAARDLDAADLEDLCAFAAAAAAVTCSRPGADPPWTAELQRLPSTPRRT
jgi:fructokinase